MKKTGKCPECGTVFPLLTTKAGKIIMVSGFMMKKFCNPQCRLDYNNKKNKYNIDNQAMKDINGLVTSVQKEWSPNTKITDGWIRLKIGSYIDNKIKQGKKIYKP